MSSLGLESKENQFTSIDYVHQLQGTLHRGIFEGSIVINTLIVVKVNASSSVHVTNNRTIL